MPFRDRVSGGKARKGKAAHGRRERNWLQHCSLLHSCFSNWLLTATMFPALCPPGDSHSPCLPSKERQAEVKHLAGWRVPRTGVDEQMPGTMGDVSGGLYSLCCMHILVAYFIHNGLDFLISCSMLPLPLPSCHKATSTGKRKEDQVMC